MGKTRQYDVVVIGGGSTGENVAWYARENDLSVALVESELIGGECSYWACMPSKALLRPGEALAAARRVPGAEPAVTGQVDVKRTLSSRDSFASSWDDTSQAKWVESVGADIVRGHGRIAGERRVDVETPDGGAVTLEASRAVVVATGTLAALPPIDAIEDVGVWDNRDITSAEEIPSRLLVLGGGVVGVEMAQAFRRLGSSQVTIVEMTDHLLPPEEAFAGRELQDAFEQEGITVRTEALGTGLRRNDDGQVVLTLKNGDEVIGDEILVATGRRARTQNIGLETIGLEPDGFLEVDGHLRVAGVDGDWLYAAGDVNGRALLTHQGKYQARVLGDLLGGREGPEWPGTGAWADDRAIPRVVFTDPQVAAVGRTEQQARDAGLTVRTADYDLGHTAGGALRGKGVSGTAKIVIDDDGDVIVGATFVGPDVGEMLHAATIAIVGEVPITRLWHAVPAFPTVSEVWLRLLEADRGIS
ncbi:MAG: NAD(P)/FAD-dependent oxidoreductase [Actinomycetota bacterium]|nr:NAD(P)/FAD-dependent oxidoreductase [Actinomycetota bacterium]